MTRARLVLFEENVPRVASSGGHVATLGLLRFLRELGECHLVNVVSESGAECWDDEQTTVFRVDASLARRRIRKLLSPLPKMVAEVDWQRLWASCSPTIAVANRVVFGSAKFLQFAQRVRHARTYYVADNVEWELILAMQAAYRSPWLARLDARKLRHFEARGIAQVGKACAFTQRDADRLAALSGRDVEVVPPILEPATVAKQPREPFALYPTNLKHPPNVDAMEWLASEVWPRRKGSIRLVVTGAGDFAPYAARMPDAEFRGLVPRDELEGLFATAGVVLNPTRTGSGFQIKLLEALSSGCPVVSTGFSNPLGPRIASSDDPGTFAALVSEALAAPKSFNYAEFYAETRAKLTAFFDL